MIPFIKFSTLGEIRETHMAKTWDYYFNIYRIIRCCLLQRIKRHNLI